MNDPTPEMIPAPASGEVKERDRFPYATWGPWIAIGGTVAALIAGLVLSLPIFLLDGGADTDDLSLFATVAVQIFTAIGFVLIPFTLAISYGGGGFREAFHRLGFRSFDIAQSTMWVVLGILSYFAFSIVYAVIFGTPEQDDIAGDFGPIQVQILLIVIVAPFAEEICFRGMLFGGFRRRLPLWAAAPAAAAVFGLLHYSTGWSTVVPLMFLGMVFAVVYEKTRSIWPAIGMHMFNNALALIVLTA